MLSKLFEQKWIYAVMSVLLAILFWFYVRKVEDPEQAQVIRDVPVTIAGENILANQGLTVSDISQDTVDLTVRANISVLDQLNRNNVSVALDVSKCAAAGEYELRYTIVYPTTVNVSSVVTEGQDPQYLTVTVDKLYTESFPIDFSLHGSVAAGYQAGQYTVSPETVTVSGAVEQVSKIERVVAVLEREGLAQRFSGDLPLKLMDAAGNELTDLEVKLSATSAYVTLPIVVVHDIPITVRFLPGGGAKESDITYEIEPKKLTVSGSEEDLLPLKEISLGSVDLSKVVGTNSFTFPIDLDPSLENVSGITEAVVTVTVNGLSTRTFDVTNIELANVPDIYFATTPTQMRTVVVRGKQEALDQIDASQLRIVADLGSVTAVGTTSVPVKVYLDATSEVGVIGEYSIVVNVGR